MASTCETCGKADLMTEQSLTQHVTDKEDNYHKGRDPYPVVCDCRRRFMTSQEMTSHEVGECSFNLDTLFLDKAESDAVGDNDNFIREELKKNLDQYFEDHVKVDEREMEEAKAAAKKVTEHILLHLGRGKEPNRTNLALCDADPVGSSFDGLKVAPADEFDMTIPIELNEMDWEIVDARTAVVEDRTLNAPGFWLLKKKSSGQTTMDSYLTHTKDGGVYVAPASIIRTVQPKIHRIIGKIKHPQGIEDVSAGVKGPSIYMQVEYTSRLSRDAKKFDLDFVLEVRVADAPDKPRLVAKRHPSVTQQGFYNYGEDPMALLWQESSAKEESEKIRGISKEGPLDCRKKCWKLVKALAIKNKHLGSFNTYFYKTLFLHLLDEVPDDADWDDARLADRFLDVFKKMEKVLHQKFMPLYFARDVNMLLPRYDPMQVENVYYYVRKINAEGSHMQLLYGGLSTKKKREKAPTVKQKKKQKKAASYQEPALLVAFNSLPESRKKEVQEKVSSQMSALGPLPWTELFNNYEKFFKMQLDLE